MPEKHFNKLNMFRIFRKSNTKEVKDNVEKDIISIDKDELNVETWRISTKLTYDQFEKEIYTILKNKSIRIKEIDQAYDYKCMTIGGINVYSLSSIGDNCDGWSTFSLHKKSKIGLDVAIAISEKSETPVIAIIRYESDNYIWGYILFEKGIIIDKFCNLPDKVGLTPEEYVGNAELVQDLFNVDIKKIEHYLKYAEDFNSSLEMQRGFCYLLGIRKNSNFSKSIYVIEKGIND